MGLKDNISAFTSTEYDEKIKRTLPYYEEFYKQVIDTVKVYSPHALKWLDVGCGTGKMADFAFKEAVIKKFVFCDCASEMIEIAKKRFNVSNAEFIVSDIRELNFRSEFDVITAIQVNHYFHSEERKNAISKCYRALKKGGIFINFENFAPFSKIGEQLYLDRWRSYQLKQGKKDEDCDKHIKRYNEEYFPISLSEHLRVMSEGGFTAVEILWLSYMQVGILGIK